MSAPSIPLPKNWADCVKSALVHVFSLARITEAATQAEAIDSGDARNRKAARDAQLEQEIALVREELRIKDARMGRMPPAKRTQYKGTERLQILELRAARGWSVAQTAERFHVTEATISSWNGKLDEQGEDALVKMPEPVNRYPDYVRQAVQRVQSLCPRLGKVKIAQILTRAGLHIATSTVGRIRREKPVGPPAAPPPERGADAASAAPPAAQSEAEKPAKRINAKYPNHVWLWEPMVFLGRSGRGFLGPSSSIRTGTGELFSSSFDRSMGTMVELPLPVRTPGMIVRVPQAEQRAFLPALSSLTRRDLPQSSQVK